jgi:hypothetical protein
MPQRGWIANWQLICHFATQNGSFFVIDWNNIQQAVYLPGCEQNFVENLGKVRSVSAEDLR